MAKTHEEDEKGERLSSLQRFPGKPLDIDQRPTPEPPNGGYGWVIVAATFMCATIICGIGYSFGVLLVDFADYYQAPKRNVAWIGSLLNGFTFIIGPLASALVTRFGTRPVAIAGGLISSLAFLLSTIAPNIRVLAFTYGILGGSGLGFIALPNIINVNYYFSTQRKLAVAIATTGCSVGNFIIPPFVNFLLKLYDWKGAVIIISGISLNSVVFSALMRPLETIGRNAMLGRTVVVEERLNCRRCQGTIVQNISDNIEAPIQKAVNTKDANANKFSSQLSNKINVSADIIQAAEIPSISESLYQKPSPTSLSLNLAKQMSMKVKSNSRRFSLKSLRADQGNSSNQEYLKRRFTMPALASTSINELCYPSHYSFIPSTIESRSIQNNVARKNRTPSNDDFYCDHNIKPEFSESKIKQSNEILIQITSRISSGEDELTVEFKNGTKSSKPEPKLSTYFSIFKSILDTMKEVLNFSLLKDTKFLITCVAYTIGMMGYFIPFAFLPHTSVMKGIDRDKSAFLISVLGGANFSSRLVVGFISDKLKMRSLDLNSLSVFVSGGACLAMPFCFSYVSFVSASIVYGFFTAPFMCLYSVVLVEMLGLEKLSSSLGILSLFRGIGYIFGSPIAGAIFDSTDSYDVSFYMAGTFLMISATLTVSVSWIMRRQEKRSLKTLQTQVQTISATLNANNLVLGQR